MTLNKLASAIAKREGKKSQARIGDIREILKLICVLEAEDVVANPDSLAGPLGAIDEGCNRELAKLRKRLAKGARK